MKDIKTMRKSNLEKIDTMHSTEVKTFKNELATIPSEE